MIISFKCKETRAVWEGSGSRKIPENIQYRALVKLRQLDAALCMDDLKNPAGNKFEMLQGNRKGQCSLRVNKQWRVCFRFEGHDAYDVHIIDYH
jgi:toxin HigB-1